MDDLTLEVADHQIDGLLDRVLEGFDAIPLPPDVPAYQSTPLAIALRSKGGRIDGGLVGHSVWGWLYVNFLWVAEELRGGGHGQRLLAAAENQAEQRGCHGVWLHTISFQAPAFYERQGYRKFGELSDMPTGYRRLFYQKRLDRAQD